jgi:NAD(P)-dependent dehydrogenase (short-subunit alcohol dehydrogenase family)
VDYAEKVALVTGAGSGIGRAISERLAAKGATVVLVDIDKAGLEETRQEIDDRGGRCQVVAANVVEREHLESAFATASAAEASFQVLCNNAGIATTPPFLGELFGMPAGPAAGWKTVVDVNLSAVISGTELGVMAMRETGGVIINTSSVAGLEPYPPDPVYAATKAALVNFTRSLAGLAQTHGIRVNCLCPALIDTPMMRRPLESIDDPGIKRILDALIPPERVADAALALIEDETAVGQAMIVAPTGNTLVDFPVLVPQLTEEPL